MSASVATASGVGASSGARLTAEALSVHLGGRAVLRAVSLTVAPGEVLGVFGPSGAGKSTLFRALAGEERPTSGVVRLDGVDVTALPLFQRARRGLGYLPQTSSVLWDLTVAENLAVFQALGVAAERVAIEPLAERIGLASRLTVLASALSGGERRRLELGRALSARPRVLLCDEPFAAIDPQGAERIGARLAELRSEGSAVLLADHNLAFALPLCDRAALLLDGEVALIASPQAFRDEPLVREHYTAFHEATPRRT